MGDRQFNGSTKAADAPDVSEYVGTVDLRFTGTQDKLIKGGQYTKNKVDGDPKLEWSFDLLDEDGEQVFDEGEPITLQYLTGVGFNLAAKTTPSELKVLKALCSKAEYEAFESGDGPKESELLGRVVQGELFVKENGYPGVSNIIRASKAVLAREAKRPAAKPASKDADTSEADED